VKLDPRNYANPVVYSTLYGDDDDRDPPPGPGWRVVIWIFVILLATAVLRGCVG